MAKKKAQVEELTLDSVAGSGSLRNEIRSRFMAVEAHYGAWNEVAKEDTRFVLGDQWDDQDRQTLKSEGRPCLTFNRIRPIINIISGYQRENSSRIKVNPVGTEDKTFSEVMDKAMQAVDKISHLNYTLGYQFDEGCSIGKSIIESYRTYKKDPIRGELRFDLLKSSQFMPDPEFMGYDLNDGCRYGFKVKKYTKDRLIELYPSKKAIIEGFKTDTDDLTSNLDITAIEGDRDDYGNNPNKTTVSSPKGEGTAVDALEIDADKKFTLKEYWRLKPTKRWYVIDAQEKEPRMFEKKEEAEAFAATQGPGFKAIERPFDEMHVAGYCCGFILEDKRSPHAPEYEGYPFHRFLADWYPNAENEELRVQGLVRALKDPQREKNKSKSQWLHILNTQANSGWIGDEDALTGGDWTKLENMGSKPGVVIKKKRGSELREIEPKAMNNSMIVREERADEEIKQISNINPDLLGLQDDSSTSGKAMQTRIRQAILALARLFSNYRFTKEILGNYILAMIPAIFDARKLARVLGPKYMQDAGLDEGKLTAYLQLIKDSRYDLTVAEADAQSSIRYETFTELVELAKTGAPIPPDLFIDYMDMPNSDEVKKRVMEYAAQQMAAAAAAKGKTTA